MPDSSMKLLHLIETTGPGGAEQVFFHHLTCLAKNKTIKNIVAVIKDENWLIEKLENIGIETIQLSGCRVFDYKLIRMLYEIIRQNEIELVHSHLPDMNFYSSIAASIAGIFHVSTEHGDINTLIDKGQVKPYIKYLFTSLLSDKIVCVSKYTKGSMEKYSPFSIPKTELIYNGIPPYWDIADKATGGFRRELGIGADDCILVNVANLYKIKGQKFLIAAMALVLEKCPATHLCIVGRGVEYKHLDRLIRRLDIQENVHLIGYRSDVEFILQESDIFVLSSLAEGFPISVIEAMFAGLPIVSSNVGGIPELKAFGVDIEFTEPRNIKQLAQNLIKQIKRHRAGMKNRNREIARKFFSVDSMTSKYVALYRSLLKNG